MDQGSDFLKDSFIIETMFVPQINLEEKSKRSPQCLIDSIQVQKLPLVVATNQKPDHTLGNKRYCRYW